MEDPALARLAGLGPLPLPFTPDAPPDEVLAHLSRLNPHRTVRFDDTNPCTPDEAARLSSQRTGARSPHRSL